MRRLKVFIINGTILTFTSIFLQFIGVSFGVYISNRIGQEAVGLYQLLMSVYSFGITLALSGINLTCMRIISEELAKESLGNVKGAIKKCLLYSLLFGLLSFFVLSISSSLIATNILHSKIESKTICIMALALPFVSICSCINGYFSAVRHVIKSSLLQIVEQFFRIFVVTYLLNYVLEHIEAGYIVLFHDIHASSVEAMEKILPYLYVEGYQVVTVSELAQYYNNPLELHKAYRYFTE